MIELQVVNHILKNKSLAIINDNSLSKDYFIAYKDEFEYILEHYREFGNIPDRETFLNKFDDFDLVDVGESSDYLVETLQEQYLFSKLSPFIHEIAKKAEGDSRDAVKYARSKLEELGNIVVGHKTGYDLVKNAGDRKADFEKRKNVDGLLGISSGIDQLDEITHGWLEDDFINIVGRTNEGKTWVMLFFLVMAWQQGKKVLFYSGEMSKTMIGFRFDTLNKHFSNLGLMKGDKELGDHLKADDYISYLDDISKSDNPSFIVVTPKDVGGTRIDIPTLHQLIEKHKPDMVGIDQLSLMEDYRADKHTPPRLRYTHIAEDLFLTSEKYGIPIMSPSQANRDSEKSKDKDKAPELVNISESDGIPQNATRVLSIKQIENTLKIVVKKNRYGMNNQEIMLIWDIDKGVIKPFLKVISDSGGNPREAQRIDGGSGEELF